MFFVIYRHYTLKPSEYDYSEWDNDTIEISTKPASYENGVPCIEGHCIDYCDWATEAYGEYETLEQARAAINENFGSVRTATSDNDDVVECYKPGEFKPLGDMATGDYIDSDLSENVSSSTTDEQIDRLCKQYEAIANDDGYTLSKNLKTLILKFRDELGE